MPLDLTRPLQTRDGRAVRIYAMDGAPHAPIHGAIQNYCGWTQANWLLGGSILGGEVYRDSRADLVNAKPPKPRITKDLWVEVSRQYEGCTPAFSLGPRTGKTIALVKVTIDCEEGEGL